MKQSPIIISGGQTGVDRGALDAALDSNWPCAGWCPEGRLAEDGSIDPRYPLKSLPGGDYADRTRANVQDSDATLILYFGELEGGTALTGRFCRQLAKPCLCLDATFWPPPDAAGEILGFIQRHGIERLNVAGPRASKVPDAREYSYAVIDMLLRRLNPL